jgi:hypothetical protein
MLYPIIYFLVIVRSEGDFLKLNDLCVYSLKTDFGIFEHRMMYR